MGGRPGQPRGLKARGFRKVKVLETGVIYNSAAECAEAIGGDVTGISKVISGKRPHHLGYTFAWAGRSDPEDD